MAAALLAARQDLAHDDHRQQPRQLLRLRSARSRRVRRQARHEGGRLRPLCEVERPIPGIEHERRRTDMSAGLLVNIDVDDLQKGATFYCDALGLRIGRRFDGWLELVGAAAPIYLLPKPSGSRIS